MENIQVLKSFPSAWYFSSGACLLSLKSPLTHSCKTQEFSEGSAKRSDMTNPILTNLGQLQMKVASFPGGSVIQNPSANTENESSIPGLGRSPGEGKGNPLQYSCLEDPMDRGAWRARVHRVARVRQDLVTKPPPLESRPLKSK